MSIDFSHLSVWRPFRVGGGRRGDISDAQWKFDGKNIFFFEHLFFWVNFEFRAAPPFTSGCFPSASFWVVLSLSLLVNERK